MKKRLLIILGVILVLGGGAGYYFGSYQPHKLAVSDFNKAYAPLKEKNRSLKQKINKSKELKQSKIKPLNSETTKELNKAISEANKSIVEVPKIPSKTTEIKSLTNKAPKNDYSVQLKELEKAFTNFDNSVKQRELVTNPSQDYIIDKLKKVATVTGTQAVTEDNDPNGSLNKPGSYTSAVFFTSSLVTEKIDGTDIVDKGTDAGGCIEVYKNIKDANKREEYLSNFDGPGLLDPGSHEVIGTVIIRTSSKLSATQQSQLSTNISNELIKL